MVTLDGGNSAGTGLQPDARQLLVWRSLLVIPEIFFESPVSIGYSPTLGRDLSPLEDLFLDVLESFLVA